MLRADHIWLMILLAFQSDAGTRTDYQRGVELFHDGNLPAAVPLLIRATTTTPLDPQAWKALGVVYAAQGEYSLAEHPLRLACELGAALEDACYYFARTLYALNRFDPALKVFGNLLVNHPESWKFHLGAAQAMEAMQFPAAEEEFTKALRLSQAADPAPGIAYGLFLIRQGRSTDALEPLNDVVRRFPNSADAHLQLGRIMEQEGKLAEAIGHLERSLAIQPNSAQAELLLGKAYAREGRLAEAQVHLKLAASYEDGSVTVR